MKITKKFVKIAVPAVGVTLVTVFVLAFMLTSFFNWQSGYNKYLEDLQWKKEHAGTVMTGMTLELADGVEFFNNGKARPGKKDFIVTASYIVDGVREYSEPLIAEDYTLSVPANFAATGGTVAATYEYFDERDKDKTDDGEAPQPTRIFEATLDVSLTKIVPARLEMVKKPYLVTYEAGSTFDIKGASFNAVLNDGTVIPVDNGVLTPTTKTLTTDDKTAQVLYTSDGITVTAEIPIRVMAKGEFGNGTLLSLEVMDATVKNGLKLKTAELEIYGVYESGNYVTVPATDYVVVNGETAVGLGDVQIIKVASRDDFTVYRSAAVRVREDAVAGDPTDNEYKFTVNSAKIARAAFSVLCKNNTAETLRLSGEISVSVNGSVKPLPVAATLAANGECAVELRDVLLDAGENTVTVKIIGGSRNLTLNGIRLENGYDGLITDYFGEYVREQAAAGRPIKLDVEPVVGFDDGLWNYGYGYGLCSDGEWIYVGMGDPNAGKLRITKIDPDTKEIAAVTAVSQQVGSLETFTGIFSYDGKIISCTPSGNFVAVDADFTGMGDAKLQPYDMLSFNGINKITNVCYNRVEKSFAVTTEDYKLYFFDGKGVKISEHNIPQNDSEGGVFLRMTGNSEYLYFSYKKNARPEPYLTVRNWSGEVLNNELKINVDKNAMGYGPDDGTPGVSLARNSNAHAVMELNGDVYYLIVCWGNGRDGYGLFKTPFNKAEYSVPAMNLGEYAGAVASAGIDAPLNAEILKQYGLGVITGGIFGICTDGEYGYWAHSKTPLTATSVVKFDLATGEKIGQTKTRVTSAEEWQDHSQMFCKDGYVYVADNSGSFFRVAADDITADGAPDLEPADDMKFGNIRGKITGVYYNDSADRFAVYTDADEIAFYDGELAFIGKTVGSAPSDGRKRGGIAGNDDFVYVLHNKDASFTATIYIYDWSGNFVGETSVANIKPVAEDLSKTRAMGMFELNGKLYFSVNDMSGTWITLCAAELDLSVFVS